MLIFHMHMPKTGGTYINHVFTNALGADKTLCHFNTIENVSVDEQVRGGVGFFSAHMPLSDICEIASDGGRQSFVITSMREPLQQLASHIHWLDHFNQMEMQDQYAGLPARIKAEVDRIGQIDFSSPRSLQDYLTTLSPTGISLFDNVQTRYLSRRLGARFFEPIVEEDARIAKSGAVAIDYILFQGRLDCALPQLSNILGIELRSTGRQNVSNNARLIDIKNAEIASALTDCVKFDAALYQHCLDCTLAYHPTASLRNTALGEKSEVAGSRGGQERE